MRILLAYDGTVYSDEAVALTKELAQRALTHGEVVVTLLLLSRRPQQAAAYADRFEAVMADLETAVTRVSPIVLAHHSGHPAEGIIGMAKGHDLIVMGKRPSKDWRAILMKPTTHQVAARAQCPVLIVRASTPLRHLLLCDSGMQSPPLLNRFLKATPGFVTPETDITVLHVMSQISAAPGIRGVQLRADAEELMESDAWEGQFLRHDEDLLTQFGITSKMKVRHGLVLDEILEELEADSYDLLVIGSHHTPGLPDFLLEDLTRLLIDKAPRPILVLP